MVESIVLPAALNRTLLATRKAQGVIDRTTGIMSTGKRVNSALDNPGNFFTARGLSYRSSDLGRVLDGIEKTIATVKTSLVTLQALERLLAQADSIVTESQTMLSVGVADPQIFEFEVDQTPTPLSAQILEANPVAYWRLNETAGVVAQNLGSGGAAINGTYQNGVALGQPGLYDNNADSSASFDGVNDRVVIPNSGLINVGNQPLRTVELVFNASTVAGRQVLYEEGGNTNALNIYIDNGLIYFNVRDAGDYGPFAITAPVVAGQTYHAAIVFDSNNDFVNGYLDGTLVGTGAVTIPLSSHTDGIGIGSLNGSSYMHDGPSPSNTYRFNGRISDVALYNRALGDDELQNHARSLNNLTTIEYRHAAYEEVLEQIDALIEDSVFRGLRLLNGGTIETFFNETRTSSLLTEGRAMDSGGLDLVRNDFNNADDLDEIAARLRAATETVRQFSNTLVNDLTILETRRTLAFRMGVTLDQGADLLTLADMNKQGATLLAAQTRLSLSITAMNLAAISSRSILSLFT